MKVFLLVLTYLICFVTSAQIGIGNIVQQSPATALEVAGGSVRFSNYGSGIQNGKDAYILAVQNNGNIVEIESDARGLQYYVWNSTVSDIDSVRALGVSETQGVYNSILNDAARAELTTATDYYIIRFVGTIKVRNSGTFNFSARSDDGSRIYVNDILILQNWYRQPSTTRTGSITLAKGEHKIEFWYYEINSGNYMRFNWGNNPDGYPVDSIINANDFYMK